MSILGNLKTILDESLHNNDESLFYNDVNKLKMWEEKFTQKYVNGKYYFHETTVPVRTGQNVDSMRIGSDYYKDGSGKYRLLTLIFDFNTSITSEQYSDLLVSPFPIPHKTLVFTRESEEGTIYYYTGEEPYKYMLEPYYQYHCGCDLVTADGISIFDLNNNDDNSNLDYSKLSKQYLNPKKSFFLIYLSSFFLQFITYTSYSFYINFRFN